MLDIQATQIQVIFVEPPLSYKPAKQSVIYKPTPSKEKAVNKREAN